MWQWLRRYDASAPDAVPDGVCGPIQKRIFKGFHRSLPQAARRQYGRADELSTPASVKRVRLLCKYWRWQKLGACDWSVLHVERVVQL